MISRKPFFRKLQAYALDPSLSADTDTITISNFVYKVPWEEPPVLQPGPRGEYVEIIDEDETGKQISEPLNLNDIFLLAQNGLKPSETNYQFHQQMLYAVSMTTIKNFERCLGRKIQWNQGSEVSDESRSKQIKQLVRSDRQRKYISTLKIYPHFLREENAFFDMELNALKFGYFPLNRDAVTENNTGILVFTCLSHDVIAHEVTHAVIHGRYGRYMDFNHPDTPAFHEAFADLVALLQHFTFPDLLKKEIARTKGKLSEQTFMVEMARQFGTAIGMYQSLRNAIADYDEKTKTWKKNDQTYEEYKNVYEPFQRGQLLVSTIFDAFTTIFDNHTRDLMRIATGGSGVALQGDLHPILVSLLADEAGKVAGQMLRMCIRALDYCPPSNISFADYLRALITADVELEEEDQSFYRIGLIEAFRKRKIFPETITNLSEEGLRYELLHEDAELKKLLTGVTQLLKKFRQEVSVTKDRETIYRITQNYLHGNKEKGITSMYDTIRKNKELCASAKFASVTGLVLNSKAKSLGIAMKGTVPEFEIQTMDLSSRVKSNGRINNTIVITLLQEACFSAITAKDKTVTIKPVIASATKKKKTTKKAETKILTGGCNLIFDVDSLVLRYSISKPMMDLEAMKKNIYKLNEGRAKEQYLFGGSEHGPDGS